MTTVKVLLEQLTTAVTCLTEQAEWLKLEASPDVRKDDVVLEAVSTTLADQGRKVQHLTLELVSAMERLELLQQPEHPSSVCTEQRPSFSDDEYAHHVLASPNEVAPKIHLNDVSGVCSNPSSPARKKDPPGTFIRL